MEPYLRDIPQFNFPCDVRKASFDSWGCRFATRSHVLEWWMGREGGLRLLTALAVDVNRVSRVSALEVGGGRISTPGAHPSLIFAIDFTRQGCIAAPAQFISQLKFGHDTLFRHTTPILPKPMAEPSLPYCDCM